MGRQEKREWIRRMDKLKYKGEQCPLCHKNTEFIVGQDNHNHSINAYCLRCGYIVADDVKRPIGTKMKLADVQVYIDEAELVKAKALAHAKDNLAPADTMLLANNLVAMEDDETAFKKKLLAAAGGITLGLEKQDPDDKADPMMLYGGMRGGGMSHMVNSSVVLDEAKLLTPEQLKEIADARAAMTPEQQEDFLRGSSVGMSINSPVMTTFAKAGFNQADTTKLAEVAVNSVGTGVFNNAQDAAAAVIKAVNSPTKFNLSGLKR